MPGFNEISPTSLMRLIGTPDCPTLIDVRLPEDLAEDPVLLPTSRCVLTQMWRQWNWRRLTPPSL